MELVLSPGADNGPDGPGPFRNEDVREWSRLDGVTGMLERARVETGRWRADTQDARHSYGKMVDSRERNSADGSLVQKARRQVEIFQSQGNSGRAFEVIRASQWSSSRATDCATYNIPITKSNEHGCIDAVRPITNGIANGTSNGMTNGGSLSNSSSGSGSSSEASPRLGNGPSWRSERRLMHQDRGTAGQDLEQLSQLCRRLHDEAISQHNRLWQLAGGTSTSPLSLSEQLAALQNDDFKCNGSTQDSQSSQTNRSSTAILIPRSSSNEDLSSRSNGTSALKDDDESSHFARDSKTRRSLRAPSSSSSSSNSDQQQQQHQRSAVRTVPVVRSELVAERAKRFEPDSNGGKAQDGANGSSPSPPRRRVNGFVGSFAPIADNDFVKNDPKHPSKIALMQQAPPATAKIANVKQPADSNGTSAATLLSNGSPITSRKAGEPHRTVVHLKISSPAAENGCSDETAKINGENEQRNSINDSSKTQSTVKDEPQQQQVVQSKPVKKVEFCKTEIHFAPDSGKVNIVETDGKPPPTNKFRRRKRNSHHHQTQHGTATIPSANTHKNNMPLVHFGDTSFEKYFFGGQGKSASRQNQILENGIGNEKKNGSSVSNSNMENGSAKTNEIDRWQSSPVDKLVRSDHNGIAIESGSNRIKGTDFPSASRSDHSKSRGAHTTTVKILNDESNALRRLAQDIPHDETSKHSSPQPMTRIATKPSEPTKNEAKSNTTVAKTIEAAPNDTVMKQPIPVKRSIITPSNKIETAQTVKRLESTDVTDQPAITKPELTALSKTKTASLNNGEEEEGIPTYENIFDAVSVYENCNLAKARRSKEARSNKDIAPSPARRRRPASTSKQQQQVVSSNGGSVEDPKRSVSRSSGGSRDGSIGKANIKPVAASRHQQPTAASRRKLVVVKANGSESGQSAVVSNVDKSRSSEITRTKKKPVEVVYETAVYNMKNEKLSKPNKGKEIKGPRLINEFICGSKVKRPSEKKTTKTATMTQNTGKRKDVPVAVSR